MIHLKEVRKTYERREGPVHALAGIDVEVAPGSFVAVRGPSGCGKTTLLSIIGGLARPSSGRVVVAGEDLGAMSAAGRARVRAEKSGCVFQMFHLLPYLTVLETVAVGQVSGANGGDARTAARQALERFGLGDRLGHRPAELSAGQRQRVAIARALINRPPLILADEPTGNLDPDSAKEVFDLLADFHAGGGTVLLVTHAEHTASRAQRTVTMRDGLINSSPGGGLRA